MFIQPQAQLCLCVNKVGLEADQLHKLQVPTKKSKIKGCLCFLFIYLFYFFSINHLFNHRK